jgi:predicted ATPase
MAAHDPPILGVISVKRGSIISGMPSVGSPRGLERHRGALPAAPNALVGRDDEGAALARLLAEPETRLLTLTGPPGVGKSRLAVAGAATVAERFPDGVVFVDLTSVRDPARVTGEVAAALGLRGSATPERLARVLAPKVLLVVLDNFEHVLDAGPAIAGPLRACPHVRLLVTSRERLHLHADREVPLHPLALPTEDAVADPDRFASTPSVAMLLQGIRAFLPVFTVTPTNRKALAEICIRLDGLPLALELAAARLRLFTPGELTFRLRHRMAVLSSSTRDVPDRHRTLRAALAWSHNLLGADERAVFRRLSVFVGGWTLDAAQQVCAVDDIVEITASLVDKNLVRRRTRSGDVGEFTMLESLREYATERLAEQGESDETCRRHARYFAGLGAEVEAVIGTAEETSSLQHVAFAEASGFLGHLARAAWSPPPATPPLAGSSRWSLWCRSSCWRCGSRRRRWCPPCAPNGGWVIRAGSGSPPSCRSASPPGRSSRRS